MSNHNHFSKQLCIFVFISLQSVVNASVQDLIDKKEHIDNKHIAQQRHSVYQVANHTQNLWQNITKSDEGILNLKRPYTNKRPSFSSALKLNNDAVKLSRSFIFALDEQEIRKLLHKNTHKQAIQIPLANGKTAVYEFTYHPIMPADLANKYNNILTFKAVDTNNSNHTGYFGLDETGFHGMFFHEGKNHFIDNTRGNHYSVYYAEQAKGVARQKRDVVLDVAKIGLDINENRSASYKAPLRRPVTDNTHTNYTIAFSAAAEYTEAVGGTKERAMAAIIKMLARLNQIYERELNISFKLVANNDKLIFLNKNTDPFNNDDKDIDLNTAVVRNAGLLYSIDVGQVLNTGSGGIAYNGICEVDYKAGAVSGSYSPNSDVFHVSYVAHELGHQLGATHTFNGNLGACGYDSRQAGTAWEVLSGSTIMSYTGICKQDDLAPYRVGSSDFFHIGSILQIKKFLSYKNCGTKTEKKNRMPTVDAGKNYTIPSKTPFVLTGESSDADGDNLLHIWEQLDLGGVANIYTSNMDDGKRPLFRSWELSSSKKRYLPRIRELVNDDLAKGEYYPNTNRTMNFMFSARDGKGGVATDLAVVTVVDNQEKFEVIEPTLNAVWQEGKTYQVKWRVANTNSQPINCKKVDIHLISYDDNGFEKTWLLNTNNTGVASVKAAYMKGNSRIMVGCSDNIFYNVSKPIVVKPDPNSSSSSNSGSGGGSISFWELMALLSMSLLVRWSLYREKADASS